MIREDLGRVLVIHGPWTAYEMQFSEEKVEWLWKEMRKYRTLFSDFTQGDKDNFYVLITSKDSFWIEVVNKEQKTIGIVYWTGLYQIVDIQVHLMFFDRMPAEKSVLCQKIARWFFDNHGQYNRMTATVPMIYHATIRLAFKIGFKREGRKRQSQLMGQKLIDEMIFGLLASEV